MAQEIDEKETCQTIEAVARGMHQQHKPIILAPPELLKVNEPSEAGQWRYLRIKFKLWPGQAKIVEETFKERIIQLLRQSSADYAVWMITITYRVE